MKVCYELTMPNNSAWNGRWTGESNKYFVVRNYFGDRAKFMKRLFDLNSNYVSFYYNFEDGWGANVRCEVVLAKEANKRLKISKGFCGYHWMINEIETYGRILGRQERKYLNK